MYLYRLSFGKMIEQFDRRVSGRGERGRYLVSRLSSFLLRIDWVVPIYCCVVVVVKKDGRYKPYYLNNVDGFYDGKELLEANLVGGFGGGDIVSLGHVGCPERRY